MRHSLKTLLCAIALAGGFGGHFPLRAVEVLSHHYDQSNLGVNSSETQLTPSDITTSTFQKLYATPVDSKIFTQPLYVPGVTVTGGAYPGKHDLVIVGTQGDILYAIDAESGVIVWQTSFLLSGLPGATTITPVNATDSQDIYNATPTIGILGTPVIDSTTHMLYVLAKTKQIIDGQPGASFVNTMYKIDITIGATSDGTPNGAPLNIVGRNDFAVTTTSDDTTFTYRTNVDPTVAQDPYTLGVGDGAIMVGTQSRVYFNALRCLQRSALFIANGNVYACFASALGIRPYHGWMLGFKEGMLDASSVTDLTPNLYLGGIWASGAHPAVDSSGNIFVALGNGYFDGTSGNGVNAQGFPVDGDYGDCLVKLVPDTTTPSNQNINGWGIKVADYFTPSNNLALLNGDLDLGCGGILLLPDSYGTMAHPHLLVTAGKEGTIYLLDRDSLGKFASTDKSVQELLTPALLQNWSTPALFNGTLYYAAENDYGKAFSIANGAIGTTPIKTPDTFALRGATPTVSANGATHGVVWMVTAAYNSPGQLRAYSAANFANEIWTSDQAANGRDALGIGVRFSTPTVADGRVFVGGVSSLVAYGLNPAVAVITSDPPTATVNVGTAYSSTFTAAGTPTPTFALTSGTLPPGLSLSSAGVLSGSPTTPGTYADTVTASATGLTSTTQSFTITIASTSPSGALKNPVGYWQFSEGAGATTADSSGSGINGTLAFSPAWVPGMFGGALNFNGTSSYVHLNNMGATGPLKPPLPVTISAWIKLTTASGYQAIFSSDNFNSLFAGCNLEIANGVLACNYGSAGGYGTPYRREKVGKTVFTAGRWYHVAAVIQGPTSMNLYVNGVDEGGTYSGTGGPVGYTSTSSKIGSNNGTSYFNGAIDDLRFYNRALNPTEVELLANGPVSNWRFDEGSGTSALDSGTAGITGSLANSPTWVTGMFSGALNFNGTSSYVNLNNTGATGPLKPPLPVTISAWIKLSTTSGYQAIFSSDNFNSLFAGCNLEIASGVLACNYGTAGGYGTQFRREKVGKTVFKAGQWYHVAAVIQGPTSMNLYVNGVDDGGTYSGTGGSLGYTTTSSKIGSNTGTSYFNGAIDDLRFYNRALSPTEIQTLDNANSGTIPPE